MALVERTLPGLERLQLEPLSLRRATSHILRRRDGDSWIVPAVSTTAQLQVRWAVLSLRFREDSVTALLGGEPLTTQEGLVASAGVCGFGSGWHEAHFSEFELAEHAAHLRTPGSFFFDLLPP